MSEVKRKISEEVKEMRLVQQKKAISKLKKYIKNKRKNKNK